MRIDDKSLAYALLRIAFGVNFAGHGLIRIYNGVAAFATTTAEHLAKSPLPHNFAYGFSYAIPFLEAVLGLRSSSASSPAFRSSAARFS
jgi:thiosulfate dehydrogenase (quinone) large subunit